MSVTNFIPTIWSARLLEHLDKAHVYGALVNRDYEGEIKQYGDTVKINQIGNITVKNYTKNSDIEAPEELSGDTLTLVIDQMKYFNFGIDDVDAAQVNPKLMDAAMQRAAYALADVSDSYIANLLATGAGTQVTTTVTASTAKDTDAYDALVDLKVALDEKSVPSVGRWVVVPPFYHGLLLKDKRFIAEGTETGVDARLNGRIGMAAGFTVYVSNNVPATSNTTGEGDAVVTTVSDYKVIAGTNQGGSFAEQVIETEAYRPEKRFADAVKGLNVYGAKVVQPSALAVLIANK